VLKRIENTNDSLFRFIVCKADELGARIATTMQSFILEANTDIENESKTISELEPHQIIFNITHNVLLNFICNQTIYYFNYMGRLHYDDILQYKQLVLMSIDKAVEVFKSEQASEKEEKH
jgi:hypothetical protein